ncbi:MAG: LysM domain-containing protein, partial [Chloroflexota bacterium]|nr:LysM domain-containing protein [Chloroflexota bacterium]
MQYPPFDPALLSFSILKLDLLLLCILEANNLHWYNPPMHKQCRYSFYGLLLLGFLLSACAQVTSTDTLTPTGTLEGTLWSLPTERPTTTPSPTSSPTTSPSPTATPTFTPVMYEVQEGDDMYGIAFFYNISPQALMTANPTINPRAMGPGTTLLIPITPTPGSSATATIDLSATPSLAFAALPAPDCYPDALGGLWCFVLVKNDEAGALENV